MKNKNTYIFIAVFAVLLLAGLVFVIFSQKKKAPQPTVSEELKDEVVPTLQPEDLGLKLTSRNDKKAVKFEIQKSDDIQSVEYEITYVALGDIPRGVIGSIDTKSANGKIESKYIDLGTCSSGKCKYDEGVSEVKFVLKITKTNNSVYQTEGILRL